MQSLCICCGRLPALPPMPPELQQFRQIALEDIPENIRLQLPESIMQKMLQPRAEQPTGLCSICAQMGCDGITPCRVPAEQWAGLEDIETQVQTADQAWENVTLLEEQWLQNQRNTFRDDSQRAINQWVPITAYYWRKETITQEGRIISEVLQSRNADSYLTRTRVTEATDPQWADTGTTEWGFPTLETAQRRCEELVADLITNGPLVNAYTIVLSHDSGKAPQSES